MQTGEVMSKEKRKSQGTAQELEFEDCFQRTGQTPIGLQLFPSLVSHRFLLSSHNATSPVKHPSLWYVLSVEHRHEHAPERWDSRFRGVRLQSSTDLICWGSSDDSPRLSSNTLLSLV